MARRQNLIPAQYVTDSYKGVPSPDLEPSQNIKHYLTFRGIHPGTLCASDPHWRYSISQNPILVGGPWSHRWLTVLRFLPEVRRRAISGVHDVRETCP